MNHARRLLAGLLLLSHGVAASVAISGEDGLPRKAASLTLAREGRTVYSIVESVAATEPEKYAARELAEFLNRVTGATYPIVAESAASGRGQRIYVGWTRFAAGNGVTSSTLGEEEWVVRTVGDELIITGGRPRGTLYGVYEFLEREVGCHWLDRNTEIIPSKPTLAVGPLNVRKKPWCWQRWLHSPTGTPDDAWRFLVRNKNLRYDFRGRRDFFPEGAFYPLNGSPGIHHTFSMFVNGNDWFKTRPEYFSLVQGQRVPANNSSGPGQLCLTHPDVLRLTAENLRKFIAKDRAEATAKGCPPPKVYWITQNDVYHAHCQCAACQAIVTREGGESGPLVEFLNAVAQDIGRDYPEILVGTIAYNLTSTPPKRVRPRSNVLIGWCDVYSKCDGIRPLSHPYNIKNYTEITGWAKIAPRLAIGDDYWTALGYYSIFPTPYAIIDCVASDLKLFADLGVESFFAETADYMEAGQQFIPLKFWLGYQLLVDPHQPVEPLIQTFMDGYYGAAAGPMREYLRYQRRRIDQDAQFQALRDEPHKLKCLDVDFFLTSQRLFDEAESRLDPANLAAAHVRDERFILDGALLFLWPWMERTLSPGQSMPFDHETVVARYEREWRSFVKGRYSRIYSHAPNCLNEDGKLLSRMAGLFRDPQLPGAFRDLPRRDVADFNWLTFSDIRPRQKFVPDDEAAGGMTATFTIRAEEGGDRPAAETHYQKPLAFGVTGGPTITLKPEDVPQDVRYHLHKIGRIRVKPGTMVWALEGQRLGVNVDRVYRSGAEDPSANDWNAYISLKAQGPAYVTGSTQPNGVWMDRVLLVKPQKDERLDVKRPTRAPPARRSIS